MDVDTSDPVRRPARALARTVAADAAALRRRDGRHGPLGVDARAPRRSGELTVRLETGGERRLEQVLHWVDPREVDGALVGEATFAIPADLPVGYHVLAGVSGEARVEVPLIVTPARLALPERLGHRGWGLAAQLYSVRSKRSWGIGDLGDLTDLAVWAGGRLGADFVLVNPLHAQEPLAPGARRVEPGAAGQQIVLRECEEIRERRERVERGRGDPRPVAHGCDDDEQRDARRERADGRVERRGDPRA